MGNNHSHKHQHEHKHGPECKKDQSDATDNQHDQTKNKLNPDQMDLPHYGGRVTVDKANKLIIKFIQVYEFQYEYVQKLIKKRMALVHPNLITVKNYSFQSLQKHPQLNKQQGLMNIYCCYPESKVLRMEFQPAILNLNGLIKSYCQQRRPMEEVDIRRIMRSVVQVLIFLKNSDTCHGDIKPSTIFIHPKTQQVQLIDSYLIHSGKTAFDIVNQNPKSQSFLTPEQLDKKKFRDCQSFENVYQSQVFCLGLTLLEMMTFQASMQAYNLQVLEIRTEFVERKMVEMKEYGYSYQLADLAMRCIHKEAAKRPKFQEILRCLQ